MSTAFASPFAELQDYIDKSITGGEALSDFISFEPWDVGARPAWFLEEVAQDGVKWGDPFTQAVYGAAPHVFQSGLIFSDQLIALALAATQSGKSLPMLIDIIITLTGELPIAFRFPTGHVTDVKRKVCLENIRRWGRFAVATGSLLDHNELALLDATWDCGCIVGAGCYPTRHLCTKDDDQVWVGTFKQAKDTMWLPRLKALIPQHLLNIRRYDEGYEGQKCIFHFLNGRQLHLITYEQDYRRFESKRAKLIVLDEEPPDRRIFAAALSHAERLRICMTPYNGITWMYYDVLKHVKESQIAVFHATGYDSPYETRATINARKAHYRRYEIAARVYGLFASTADKPYFDQQLLLPLAGRYCNVSEQLQLFHTVPEKFDLTRPDPGLIECARVEERSAELRDVWEVYERPRRETAYWLAADTAEGAETNKAAGDANIAYVLRGPLPGDPDWPVVVACLHCTLPVRDFARECLKAATWFNAAMLAPESRGETAAYFVAETRDWPTYFKMNVMRDADNVETSRLGFYTSPSSRKIVCDLLSDYLCDHSAQRTVNPFLHHRLLEEYQQAITDDKGRMDHSEVGSTDCLIGFGIGLYVWKYGREQVRLVRSRVLEYNTSHETGISPAGHRRMVTHRELRPVLGGRGLDEREHARSFITLSGGR